jgi:adenylosuccinate lyase
MEAGRRVKVEGLDNNLLDLIAQDEAFQMTKEELEASMDPSRYTGRAKQQVEAYLHDVIAPLLAANQDVLGVQVEIHV